MKNTLLVTFVLYAQGLTSVAVADTLSAKTGSLQVEATIFLQGTYRDISEGMVILEPQQIKVLAENLKRNRDVNFCHLEGHVNDPGSTSRWTMELSAARIESVISALHDQGIDFYYVKEPRGGMDSIMSSPTNRKVEVRCSVMGVSSLGAKRQHNLG